MKKVKDILNFNKLQSGMTCDITPPTSYGLDIISVKHLTKQFMGIKAIDDLSVNIPQAMTVGLIGGMLLLMMIFKPQGLFGKYRM